MSDCSQILEQADKALYVAKESGRNKVIRWKQSDTVANVNDTVVIDINDKNSKDSRPATDDKGKISLLQSEVEELQNKLYQLEKPDGLDEATSIDAITKLPSRLIFHGSC